MPKAHSSPVRSANTKTKASAEMQRLFSLWLFVSQLYGKYTSRAVVQLVSLFIDRKRPVSSAVGTFESRPLRQHKDESLCRNAEAFFVCVSQRKIKVKCVSTLLKERSLSTIHGLGDICASMHFVVQLVRAFY